MGPIGKLRRKRGVVTVPGDDAVLFLVVLVAEDEPEAKVIKPFFFVTDIQDK